MSSVWGALLVGALAALGSGCGEPAATAQADAADSAPPPTELHVGSRDGVLRSSFPVDVVVQEFEHAVAGTSADGGFRLFLEHYPPDKLIRLAGSTKDALVARGWEVTSERHYEAAIEVVTGKGKAKSHITRVTWFVERSGRVLLCEGIARDVQKERLGEPLKRLCEQVEVKPADAGAPAPPAECPPPRTRPRRCR